MRNSVDREKTVSRKRFFGSCNFQASQGSANVCQCAQKNLELQEQPAFNKSDKKNLRTVENLILRNSFQPYQFTFLTAVKRKYMLGEYDPKCYEEPKMDCMKSMKPTDLMFSQNSNFTSKESLLSSEEFLQKFDLAQKEDMAFNKFNDKVHRKLDFTPPDGPTIINCENVEPLKIPDFAISKKKDGICRDNSKEKENKIKRVKKDSPIPSRNLSSLLHNRHVAKREAMDSLVLPFGTSSSTDMIKNKAKSKNPSISVPKKDDEKRNKFIVIPLSRPKKEKLLNTKNRSSSSDSTSHIDSRKKLHEKILIKESYKALFSDFGNNRRPKTASSITSNSSKKSEDLSGEQRSTSSFRSDSDGRFSKLKRPDPVKKSSRSESEEIMTLSSSDQHLSYSAKSKSSSQNSDEPKYLDSFMPASASNYTNSSTNIETKFSEENPVPDRLLDPRRISFRSENYSPQPEFCDLITPDINLTIRTKRKKQSSKEMDSELRDSTSNSTEKESQIKSDMVESMNDSILQVIERSCSEKNKTFENNGPQEKKSKAQKIVKVVEVQTQTANDIATQTETVYCNQGINIEQSKRFFESSMQADSCDGNDSHLLLSLNSETENKFQDSDRVEEISLAEKLRATSEISLHETTSSIKTETNTEINISAQSVSYNNGSFNKCLDFELAQLIKDEKQISEKIEMLFKSREKTLSDKTKKLEKLQEQKRALKDTGQNRRQQVSSVVKKQRALLLKYEQEKEEMNRLKELHKRASKERKLMLEKQRNMFNPDMTTKNILNILKRSSDSQSPRRSSGPMKGYDIRSNSSMSSLIDSDRSQLDRSQLEFKLNGQNVSKKSDKSLKVDPDLLPMQESTFNSSKKQLKEGVKSLDQVGNQKDGNKLKYDVVAVKKYEEKMPKSEGNKIKLQKFDLQLKGNLRHSLSHEDRTESESYMKSESELLEEVSKINKAPCVNYGSRHLSSHFRNESFEKFDRLTQQKANDKIFERETLKRQQFMEIRDLKRKASSTGNKSVQPQDSPLAERLNKLRKGMESDRSDESYQNSILEGIDFNESHCSYKALVQHCAQSNNFEDSDVNNPQNVGNLSTRSQLSLRISHHSSNDSEKSFSTSLFIRSHDSGAVKTDKLEQILKARELTLASRKNCVREWMEWHARLREEENKVSRMEQATYNIVSSTAKALLHNDSTLSSDNSDVEGRIERLSQKLADRRLEMAKLKKEARKQAKQRLRALEINLMNQIKKYDTAIDDMRRKIESKKCTNKESGKLSIEPKMIDRFKVPEMPIKKIQEIYQSSDLLRSRTDSTVLSVPISQSVSNDAATIRSEKSDSGAIYSAKNKGPSSQSSNISEDIQSESSSKSPSELVKTANISEESTVEEVNKASESTSLIFSKKLDNIQIHNKELGKDIYNLENDLKELSDLMSNLSQKSQGTSEEKTEIVTQTLNINGLDDDMQKQVDDIISSAIPDTEELVTSTEELDHNAKSKEILNQIERSMINEDSVYEFVDSEKIESNSISEAISAPQSESEKNENEVDPSQNNETPTLLIENQVVAIDKTEELEKPAQNNEVIHSDMDDSGLFLPRCESTQISTFMLKLDSTNDTTDPSFGIQPDQFNDILEIIERETKDDEEIEETSKSIVDIKNEKNLEIINSQEIETSEDVLNRTFEITKGQESETASEESLEVSEINNSESEYSRKLSRISEVSENHLSSRKEIEENEVIQLTQKQDSSVEEPLQKSAEEEQGEELDTPRGVPDIEFDSPREDSNNSRLDVDSLDDDLLSSKTPEKKSEFPATIVTTSEKDIEAMIDKLKASLDQPGTDVAELEAKLLRIEQLQIELEIKKLEAEEVSYFVREIPNKPPPPYTPPAQGRILKTHISPTPPPAVIPSNIEELSAVTEKASGIIFAAKASCKNIMELEAPVELCEPGKEVEALKNDRRTYNAFLFDLCKEIAAELYKSDEENPGPSWTKPNVKTKPVVKIPRTVEELNEYVSKEVATLFGFKTKLQRENMVMRWSRKRRDRVDELLAREAQAEEKEWTKFHHDELAVKNELTVTILDSLVRETTAVLKEVYAKKRKVTV